MLLICARVWTIQWSMENVPVATSAKIKVFFSLSNYPLLIAPPARSRAWWSSSSAYISADHVQVNYSCYEFMVALAVLCPEDRSHSSSPHLLSLTFFLPPLQRALVESLASIPQLW